MLRRWMAWLVKLLNRPLFGTFVVPRGALVDADLFPEDEYPLRCTKCRYLLRGLPDGRCPECGTTFERGRLLVQQYLVKNDELAFRSTPAGKWGRWLLIGGAVALIAGNPACWGLAIFVGRRTAPANASQAANWIAKPVILMASGIGCLMLVGAGILFLHHSYRTLAKRRRIYEALRVPQT